MPGRVIRFSLPSPAPSHPTYRTESEFIREVESTQ